MTILPSEPPAAAFALNPDRVVPELAGFIRDQVERAGRRGVVLGLSGGIDSSLVAHLAVQALGAERVHAYFLPYRSSSSESLAHADLVANRLGLSPRTVDITPMVDALEQQLPSMDRRRKGNSMARMRMIVLYDRSEEHNALVIGTSNRTETLLGYGTLHGDAAWGFNPIGNLYKSQVRQLSRAVGVDGSIVDKAPTADLWSGQTDEGEMGFSYDLADRVLYLLVDRGMRPGEIAGLGYQPEAVNRVVRMVRASEFKRSMPPVAAISY